MCGIAGIVGNYSIADLKAMLKATNHRGPDNTGFYNDEDIAMGMNRLAIIDLSKEANQPQISENGRYVIVFNGEIYNYLEIKKRLSSIGYSFKTNSDTEVLLLGYEYFGKDLLQLIRGMFSFVIWDKNEKVLFAAKDHLGVKPLLFAKINNTLIFCSEIKGFLALVSSDFKKLNMTAVHSFISLGHQLAPNTMLENIESLLPGHFLMFRNGSLVVEKYWDASEFIIGNNIDTYESAVAKVKKMVEASVGEQLTADVPVGVLLSGGLDSGILVAVASKILNHKELNTFTIALSEGSLEFDETQIARKIAKTFNTKHHEILIQSKHLEDLFDDFILAIDQPSRDGLNSYLVSREVGKSVKVALSGLGGDELFFGYNGMFNYMLSHQRNIQISPLLNGLSCLSKLSNKLHDRLYRELSGMNFIQNYIVNLQPHINTNRNEYFNLNIDSNLITHNIISQNYKFPEDSFNKIRSMYIQIFMSNMLLRDSDAASMRSSIEVRFPLIDHRLVQMALSIPQKFVVSDLKKASNRNYSENGLKQILFDAFKGDLPIELYNQTKRGFQLPTNFLLKKTFRAKLEETIYNPSNIFNKKELIRTYNRGSFEDKRTKDLWGIMVLDHWIKVNKLS